MVQCAPGSAARMIDSACGCHLLVSDVSVEHNNSGAASVKCKFVVLASTDPSQVGKEQTEYYQVEGKAVDKLYNLAEACGLITAAQRKAAAEAGVGMDIPEDELKGKQFCGKIEMEPNMRKNPATGANEVDPVKPGPYPRLGFRTFSVTDKKAEGIPKDQQFLGIVGQQGQQQQTSQQPPHYVTPPLPLQGQGGAPGAGGMNW